MKTPLPPEPKSYTSRKIAQFGRYLSGFCLILIGLILIGTVFAIPINHPPTVSWLRDQALTSGTQFDQVFFRAWDNETTLSTTNITPLVENASPNFYSGTVHITACTTNDSGCPQDGTGYKLTFDPLTHGDGAATIKITVTDAGGKSAASSFTLRKQSGAINPPVIAGIPNETIQSASGVGYGPVWFVVSDLNTNGQDDAVDSIGNSRINFIPSCDNTNLVPLQRITIEPVPGIGGRAEQVTVLPLANHTGRAVYLWGSVYLWGPSSMGSELTIDNYVSVE